MKRVCVLVLLVLLGSYANANNVLMFVSEGFYAPEYYTPRAILERQGHNITVAGKLIGPLAPDRRNVQYQAVVPDITFDQVNIADYDAFVFAGGNGAWEDFFPNTTVHNILAGALSSKKIVALLCSSTGLLGVANNLSGDGHPVAAGRTVTGYKRVKGLMVQMGKVNYIAGEEGVPQVVVDGNLITGRDPISSELFGNAVADALKQGQQ